MNVRAMTASVPRTPVSICREITDVNVISFVRANDVKRVSSSFAFGRERKEILLFTSQWYWSVRGDHLGHCSAAHRGLSRSLCHSNSPGLSSFETRFSVRVEAERERRANLSFHCSSERELQLQNPCMATLTTGGMLGGDVLGNQLSFIRPIGHRIYVPMETSFANGKRYQIGLDDEEKKAQPSAPGPPS